MKELITKWQALTAEVKRKTAELSQVRQQVNELDVEHSTKVNEWNIEKEDINNTIAVLTEEIREKKTELERIEKESTELRRKIEERKLRNKSHLEILEKRRIALNNNVKIADERDASIRERFELFNSSREELRQQLTSSIAKIEEMLPQETASHEQQVCLLESKVSQVEALIKSQAQEWALEGAIEKWNATVFARSLISSDIMSAEHGKGSWAGIINEIQEVKVDDVARQVQTLLTRLKVEDCARFSKTQI